MKTPNEAKAHERIELVLTRYEALLSDSTALTETERKVFRDRLKLFRRSFDDLAEFLEFIRILEMFNRLDRTYFLIDQLVGASFLLGSAGAISTEVRKFHDGVKLKGGRGAKAVHDDPRTQLVENLIKAEAAKRKITVANGDTFSQLIGAEVRAAYRIKSKDLKIKDSQSPDYPKDSTIKRLCGKIKREAKTTRVSPTKVKT